MRDKQKTQALMSTQTAAMAMRTSSQPTSFRRDPDYFIFDIFIKYSFRHC